MPEENKPASPDQQGGTEEKAPETKPASPADQGATGSKKKNWFFRHKVLTIVGIIVVLIIAIIALGGGNASFDVSVGSLGDKSAECHYGDKDLCKFLNKLAETDSVSMELEMGSEGSSTKSTVKIQGSDKTQIVTTANGRELNIITIGKNVYVKQTDGSWNKYVDEAGEISNGSNTDWKGDLEKSLSEESTVKYEKIGKEKCGNLNCIKYKMTDSSDSSLDTFLYFDDKDHLLRKASSEKDGNKTEVTYSYDNVNISEPANTKTVNSAAELYGGVGL